MASDNDEKQTWRQLSMGSESCRQVSIDVNANAWSTPAAGGSTRAEPTGTSLAPAIWVRWPKNGGSADAALRTASGSRWLASLHDDFNRCVSVPFCIDGFVSVACNAGRPAHRYGKAIVGRTGSDPRCTWCTRPGVCS